MGGGMLVFSLDGKGPYDDPNLDEYSTTVEQ
jgi:methanol dehydrogenase (cytochrome c) subunit 1